MTYQQQMIPIPDPALKARYREPRPNDPAFMAQRIRVRLCACMCVCVWTCRCGSDEPVVRRTHGLHGAAHPGTPIFTSMNIMCIYVGGP